MYVGMTQNKATMCIFNCIIVHGKIRVSLAFHRDKLGVTLFAKFHPNEL